MTFTESLREKITKAPFRSRERDVFKVVLGEIERSVKTLTDEQCYTVVKSMIATNTSNLALFKEGDERKAAVEEENRVLQTLLPNYLSVQQILDVIGEDGLEDKIKAAKDSGVATGVVMGHLKKKGLPVTGNEVKQAVEKVRS